MGDDLAYGNQPYIFWMGQRVNSIFVIFKSKYINNDIDEKVSSRAFDWCGYRLGYKQK